MSGSPSHLVVTLSQSLQTADLDAPTQSLSDASYLLSLS